MSAAMSDIQTRVPTRGPRIFATVHRSNLRSLRLCRRYGLVNPMSDPPDPSYTRLIN